MVDWSASMQQTFEYCIVDPGTWKDIEILRTVKSCTINRDLGTETLGSATFDITTSVGECYIRVYLVTIQNGIRERHPLGTFLVQTPSSEFDGKVRGVSMDAYTPLLELKENKPPIGYFVQKGEDPLDRAYRIVREKVRAPVIAPNEAKNLYFDFVANTEDTWMSFTDDLLANANYIFDLDELGRISFAPKRDIASLQPVWTYNDNNSSILHPEFSMDHDLYEIPNVVEVIFSTNSITAYTRIPNEDPNSPTSIVNRGREILYRDANPSFMGTDPNLPFSEIQARLDLYAEQLLKDLSTVEYTISYTHGYCPVRLGDCVRLNYTRADVTDIKAKVVSQSLKCEPGCPVTEKAVFTTKLWR